jgi:hypothetical protein
VLLPLHSDVEAHHHHHGHSHAFEAGVVSPDAAAVYNDEAEKARTDESRGRMSFTSPLVQTKTLALVRANLERRQRSASQTSLENLAGASPTAPNAPSAAAVPVAQVIGFVSPLTSPGGPAAAASVEGGGGVTVPVITEAPLSPGMGVPGAVTVNPALATTTMTSTTLDAQRIAPSPHLTALAAGPSPLLMASATGAGVGHLPQSMHQSFSLAHGYTPPLVAIGPGNAPIVAQASTGSSAPATTTTTVLLPPDATHAHPRGLLVNEASPVQCLQVASCAALVAAGGCPIFRRFSTGGYLRRCHRLCGATPSHTPAAPVLGFESKARV